MDTELPPQCGYNYVYPLKWRTGGYGIGLHTITIINKFAKHRWGWYFEPNKNIQKFIECEARPIRRFQ